MPVILEFELGTMAVAGLVIHAQEHCRRINIERGEDRTAIRADGRGDIVVRLFIPEGPVIRIVDRYDLRRVVGQRLRTRGLLVGVGGRGVGFASGRISTRRSVSGRFGSNSSISRSFIG